MNLSEIVLRGPSDKRQFDGEHAEHNKRPRYTPSDYSGTSVGESTPESMDIDFICYGMLADDIVQFKRPPKPAELKEMTPVQYDDGHSYMTVEIDLEDKKDGEKVGTIKITNERDLGVLSNNTYQALRTLHEKHGIKFKAVITESEWKEKLEQMSDKASWTRISVNVKLNLILWGPQSAGGDVAKALAKQRRYLQDPILGSHENCLYDNPQSLSLPPIQDIAITQLDTASRNPATPDDGTLDHETTDIAPQPDPSSLIVNIDSFMNSLSGDDHLTQISVSSDCLITKLLSHQRKGIDFIRRREQREYIPDRSLWQKILQDDGEDCYQHEITGAKSPTPADCYGGIIADDMGLGKTLTMLSAIINSKAAAQQFSVRPQGPGSEVAKSTVVIVPSELLLRTWANEISKHIRPGILKVYTYHGTQRREEDANLRNYDIILTTYGTAMAEHRKHRSGVLYCTKWYRLILDEAHTIRNFASKQFQAVNEIPSQIRWCLSGTPIQNSLDDLGSLVRFLLVPVLDNPATFRKHIFSEQASTESTAQAKDSYPNLRQLLGAICLRRNMTALPNMTYKTTNNFLEFTSSEREQYVSLGLTLERLMDIAIKQQISKNNTKTAGSAAHHIKVMEAFLRLRMFCNNGMEESVNAGVLSQTGQPDEILSLLQQSGENKCAQCTCDVLSINGPEDSDSGYLTRCFRLLCHDCSVKYKAAFRQTSRLTCTLCEKDHGIDRQVVIDDHSSPAPSGEMAEYPTKIAALVRDVEANYLAGKCVIFSFWKRTLDVVEKAFKSKGIKFARIDGEVAPKRRKAILDEFQLKSGSRVLMMTFSTGGVGLNGLTVANRIHILEPQWNPAVEKQAIGRVVRLDQAKKVTVVRYAMKDTIEEFVQTQQHKKLQIAGGGFADRDQRDLKISQLKQLGSLLAKNNRPPEVVDVA
ncbi:SNF2 family N-terminal domain-containing protein [Podospora fimiseda]|uniref:SNF2 family N-terminal domain-containing protein n=1 Tax=Podospora fimiseda TaxID=252190 RepID=A0AAN7BGC3_9PEZI|nr:SNF2 family N-terminal domain-containing protein [Podospora fimiseda]